MPEAEFKKRTLNNLCTQRPTWLDLAHRKLDAVGLPVRPDGAWRPQFGWSFVLGVV
jgi:hypothetical protein